MAQEISKEWNEITRLGGVTAQIQAMQGIKNFIRPEDISLKWENWKNVKGGKQIYWYSYSEEDHQPISYSGLSSNEEDSRKYKGNKGSGSTPSSPPPKVILTFREFLDQNPGLLYLSEREQKEEYHKYLASMGVKPPSSQTRPTYQDNEDK